jgi:hypothetical protein
MPTTKQVSVKLNLPFKFVIRQTRFTEYKKLAQFHYRAGSPGPVTHTFGLYCLSDRSRLDPQDRLAGIIVYSMPPLNSQLRNTATDFRYTAADPRSRATLVNREVRTISRVIIHPQFRSLGLAAELVKQTLPLPGTLFVESSAVMGLVNPFFVKAGMTMFTAPNDLKRELLLAAFARVNLPPEKLLDTKTVIDTIGHLNRADKTFILRQIDKYFLQARRGSFSSNIPDDLNWIIPRLAYSVLQRPAYFIWKNWKRSCSDRRR